MSGSHGRITPSASSRASAFCTVRSLLRVYRTNVFTLGNAPRPSGPAWLARPTSTKAHESFGLPLLSTGTGAMFSAHDWASTLIGDPQQACRSGSQPLTRSEEHT